METGDNTVTSADDGPDAIEVYRQALTRAAEVADVALHSGTDLVPAASAESAVQMKKRLGAAHQQIARVRRDALVAQKAAKELIEAKKQELNAMIATMDAQLKPLQAQMARFEDGIYAFNLYLGRDEEIILLRDGRPAPADTPTSVRQTTLAMDEESAIAADMGGIDFENVDLFIQWLIADAAHIDQLIPEAKSIVALRPRNKGKNYSTNRRENDRMNAANWQTSWLIRNGEQLWLTFTDFKVGDHMIPTASEFTNMFVRRSRGGDIEHLQPGSDAWIAAEAFADAYTRHYMKVALILQGLIDRTKVFHPLPEAGVSFLEQSYYDSGVIKVITDAEMAIGTGRQPFNQWLNDAGARLETGMRVIGSFSGYGRGFNLFRDTRDHEFANVRPQGARPQDGVYVIKPSADPHFEYSFTFDRGEVWDRDTLRSRPAKTMATGMFNAGDSFVLPIDTVTIEEIEEYLSARTERHAYSVMFPLLTAALNFKCDERVAETPFRDALAAHLITLDQVKLNDAALTDAKTEADDLIAWYKTSNRWHRALEPEDAKAARLILAEARRRRNGSDKDAVVLRTIHAAIESSGNNRAVMAIARRSNDYVAVIPEIRKYPEAAVSHTVFVTLLFFTAAGTVTEKRDWVNLTRAQISRWSILESDERWENWTIGSDKKIHFTDPEIDSVANRILNLCEHEGTPFELRWSESKGSGTETTAALRVVLLLTGTENGHRKAKIDVTRSSGQVLVQVGGERNSRWGQSDEMPEWRVNYWGEIQDKAIWNNPKVEAAEATRWKAQNDSSKAKRALHSNVSEIVRSISRAWIDRGWERLKERYIDDFGDDNLWDEHKKALNEPRYPYSDFLYENSRGSMSLYSIAETLVKAGNPPYGMTVAAALKAPGLTDLVLPDDILDLEFAAEKE